MQPKKDDLVRVHCLQSRKALDLQIEGLSYHWVMNIWGPEEYRSNYLAQMPSRKSGLGLKVNTFREVISMASPV